MFRKPRLSPPALHRGEVSSAPRLAPSSVSMMSFTLALVIFEQSLNPVCHLKSFLLHWFFVFAFCWIAYSKFPLPFETRLCPTPFPFSSFSYEMLAHLPFFPPHSFFFSPKSSRKFHLYLLLLLPYLLPLSFLVTSSHFLITNLSSCPWAVHSFRAYQGPSMGLLSPYELASHASPYCSLICLYPQL